MTLNARQWGDAPLPAIVFWHALGPAGSAETINEVAPVLVARGRRVIGIDGPGFGASPVLPPEQYELDVLARLALDEVDALGIERFVFMGHSWGGAIGWNVVGLAPERVEALVLLDSGHIDYADIEEPRTAAERIATAPDFRWPSLEAFEQDLRDGLPRYTPEVLAAYRAGLREEGGELVGAPAEARGAAMAGLTTRVSPFWPLAAEHDIPVLLLLATQPPHVDQNRAHLPRFDQALPGADVRWIDGAGHGLLTDVGPELGDLIADWLD